MIDTAVILAGGLGTRLRPLTDTVPKPLLPVKGKPIVQHTIEYLKNSGITNIILSVGYQAEQIQDYLGDGAQLGVKLTYCIEEEPLGTGGAVKKAAQELRKPFILTWGDELKDINYQELITEFEREPAKITMVLTPRDDVEHFGVAKLEGKKIDFFVEKPPRDKAPSNLINAGAFVITPDCLDILPDGVSSLERDCFEKIAKEGEIYAFIHEGQWYPTDTLEKYKQACQKFMPAINFSQKKIIIADVDDTICESCQEISQEMAESINELIKNGFQFAFISGTDTKELQRMVSSGLTEEHHLLGATGTTYLRAKTIGENQLEYSYAFTPEEKREVMGAFEKVIEHFNLVPITSKEDQLQDRNSQITLSPLGRHAPLDMKKKYDPDGEKRKVLVEYLKKFLNEDKFDVKIGGTTSIDITRKGLDKEWGIKTFLQFHNWDLQHVLFFGDKIYPGGNDYPASKIVDCIAVNSPEDTLRHLQKLLAWKNERITC